MRTSEEMKNLKIYTDNKTSQLKKVISDLKEGSDVEGAVLVEGKNFIIACELNEKRNNENEIHEILKLIDETSHSPQKRDYESIFTHCEFEYNGVMVLAKKLKDKLTLLVMLRKRSYVSLAMLDVENSIRMIDSILEGFIPEKTCA